jgi:hypothetical protein
MSEFVNFIEKFPKKEKHDIYTKLKHLKKALTLMESMLELDKDNRDYWKKKVRRIRGMIMETEGAIIRLKIEGKEMLKEMI